MFGLGRPLQAEDGRITVVVPHRGAGAVLARLHSPASRRTLIAALSLVAAAAVALAVCVGLASSPSRGVRAGGDRLTARVGSAIDLPLSAAMGAASQAFHVHAGAGGSLIAANPAQRLRLRFSAEGAAVGDGRQTLALSPRTLLAGGAVQTLAPVTPRASLNRVTYDRAGMSEWYVNGPAGVEQGFTVRRPRLGASGTLALTLGLPAGVAAAREPGGWVALGSPGARRLRYGMLRALDATGRALPAHLQIAVGGRSLVLRVDAAHARYPVSVDPLVQEAGKFGNANEEGAGALGWSVALSADGNTALVGAPHEDNLAGGAYVFVRTGSSWARQGPELTSPAEAEGGGCGEGDSTGEGEEGDGCGFGGSVALSADGNTALIGSPVENERLGAAYVYARSGSSWSEQAKLTGDGEETPVARFGRSVALSADGATAIVGAPMERSGKGAVWIFAREGGSWSRRSGMLAPSDEQGEGRFGRRVALSADGATALIGGPTDDADVGAAWVFSRGAEGWSQTAGKLTGGEARQLPRFGYALALSAQGDLAVIGGRADNGGQGAIWTFAAGAEGWVQQGPRLTAAGVEELGEFGSSLALSDQEPLTLLVGAPGQGQRVGAVYVFDRSGESWVQRPELLAGGGAQGKPAFGASVALSADGKAALVGGPKDSAKAGAAWAFEDLPASTLVPVVAKVAPSSGLAAGGESVTIEGENLSTASAVDFGSAPSPSFRVLSATTIEALTPAGSGRVDVTVTTPAGVSALSPHDRFTFEGGSEASGVPVVVVGGQGEGGVAGTSAGAAPSCRVVVATRQVTVTAHARLRVRLSRHGVGTCRGTLSLSVLRAQGHRLVRRTIASARFAISTLAPRTVTLSLNAYGKQLLAREHGRLQAKLSVLALTPGLAHRSSVTVHLAPLGKS